MLQIKMISISAITVIIFSITSCNKQVSVSAPDQSVQNNKIVVVTYPPSASIYLNNDNTGKFTPAGNNYLWILHLLLHWQTILKNKST